MNDPLSSRESVPRPGESLFPGTELTLYGETIDYDSLWEDHSNIKSGEDEFQRLMREMRQCLTLMQEMDIFETSLSAKLLNSEEPSTELSLSPLEPIKEIPFHMDTSEEEEAPWEVLTEGVNDEDEPEEFPVELPDELPVLSAEDVKSFLDMLEVVEQAERPQPAQQEVIVPPSPPRPSSDALPEATRVSSWESVRLDHDYCLHEEEYQLQDVQELSPVPDSSSTKDSGHESEEKLEEDNKPRTVCGNNMKIMIKTSKGLHSLRIDHKKSIVIDPASVIRTDVPMMPFLNKENVHKEDNIKLENNGHSYNNSSAASVVIKSELPDCSSGEGVVEKSGVKKKRKLNLEEYRLRRAERERIRSQESSKVNVPVSCSTPPTDTLSTCKGTNIERPIMQSVEVQTQTSDIIDLTTSESPPAYTADGRSRESSNRRRRYSSSRRSRSRSSSRSRSRHSSNKRRRNSVSRKWTRSSSRSRSHLSSRSRSRSREGRQTWRSRSPYVSRSRKSHQGELDHYARERIYNRRRSPVNPLRAQEERRVIYVGKIADGTTRDDLGRMFSRFGKIVSTSVHFRERADNYGFVTFSSRAAAYEAVNRSNGDMSLRRFDVRFGGRRTSLQQRYADLDGTSQSQPNSPRTRPVAQDSFFTELKKLKTLLQKQ